MRKGILVLFGVLLAIGLLVGCSNNQETNNKTNSNSSNNKDEATTDTAAEGDKVISIGQDYDMENLDPARITAVTDGQIAANIFDSLMFNDIETGELIEGLAESFTASEDKLTYTFKLKQGVQFHKGYGEMTSEDVKYTIERIQDPETKARNRNFMLTIEEINTPDKYTVELKLNQVDPMLLNNLAEYWTGIVSKKAVEEKGDAFNTDPIGTGPFVFEGWKPQTATTLVKNEEWYRGEIDPDKIRFVPIPEPSTLYLAFESGDLDIIQVSDPRRLEQYSNDDRFYIEKEAGYIVRFIGMNIDKEPFDDIKVRQALQYGYNREELLDKVLKNLSVPAVGPIPPNVKGFEPDVDKYTYDPEKAKQLLAEAGYPDGLKLKFHVPNMDRFMTPATVFQADMAKIGVEVEVEIVEATTFLQELREGKYGLYVLSKGQTAVPDLVLNSVFHSKNVLPGDNLSMYQNEEVDGWLDELKTTLDDSKREELLSKIQKQIVKDIPYLFIDHEEHIYVVNKRVENYHATPTRSLQVYTVNVK
jgi:peptide/nickel transport system substrate-binding protein